MRALNLVVTAKRCARCKNKKPANAFYVDNRRRDRLTCYCKACEAEIDAGRPPRTPTARRLIRRFAYRRAERDLRRLHPGDFEAFYAGHIAAGLELADRFSDDTELCDALRSMEAADA